MKRYITLKISLQKRMKQENKTVITIIRCVFLTPIITIVGGLWYIFFAFIINSIVPKKLTEKEIEEKTK